MKKLAARHPHLPPRTTGIVLSRCCPGHGALAGCAGILVLTLGGCHCSAPADAGLPLAALKTRVTPDTVYEGQIPVRIDLVVGSELDESKKKKKQNLAIGEPLDCEIVVKFNKDQLEYRGPLFGSPPPDVKSAGKLKWNKYNLGELDLFLNMRCLKMEEVNYIDVTVLASNGTTEIDPPDTTPQVSCK